VARRRVVVTGMGLVTPVGNDVESSWKSILAGKSGAATVEFDSSDLTTTFACYIKDFDVTKAMNPKVAKRTDTFIHYAMEATRQAMEDSGLEVTDENSKRIGTLIGSGIGGLPWIEKSHTALERAPRKVSPFFIPGGIINMASGYAAMQYKLRGPNLAIVTACTTGTHSIGMAARLIQYGDADVMVAGGTEMSTDRLGLAGFGSARALSTRNDDPERASRPWDVDRDGFVLGEGSGVVILEEYESAKKRGAKIYAELVGFGMSDDAYHMTAPCPDGEGFISTMENSLRDADIKPEMIDYINAHGTSTPTGDPIEAHAIKQLFGKHAYELATSSTKSMTGHLLGATGAVEAIFSILAMRDQVAPPTINLDNPDEGCDLNFVAHTAQERKIDYALSNSFGFGGTNGTLVFKKLDG
jgi:3-oxoacyl-[acyl-carrier-protein] synthase II